MSEVKHNYKKKENQAVFIPLVLVQIIVFFNYIDSVMIPNRVKHKSLINLQSYVKII